ncbi:hypothetical protein CP083_01870, partial [Candidatus Bathyarchaeota archaeon B24-2]
SIPRRPLTEKEVLVKNLLNLSRNRYRRVLTQLHLHKNYLLFYLLNLDDSKPDSYQVDQVDLG